MENNKASVPNYSEGNNMIGQNQMNINPKESNIPQNIDKNANEKEENDNLGYLPGTNNNNFNFNIKFINFNYQKIMIMRNHV